MPVAALSVDCDCTQEVVTDTEGGGGDAADSRGTCCWCRLSLTAILLTSLRLLRCQNGESEVRSQ